VQGLLARKGAGVLSPPPHNKSEGHKFIPLIIIIIIIIKSVMAAA
jgi:hypothetical protein